MILSSYWEVAYTTYIILNCLCDKVRAAQVKIYAERLILQFQQNLKVFEKFYKYFITLLCSSMNRELN